MNQNKLNLSGDFFSFKNFKSLFNLKKRTFREDSFIMAVISSICYAVLGNLCLVKLGLESIYLRCWYRKLGMFYRIYKNKSPQYVFKLIPEKTHAYATRNLNNVPCFKIEYNFLKNSFFPSTIIEWNNLEPTLLISKSFIVFKNSILKFIRPSPSNFFNCDNRRGIRLITRLRIGMSHLCEHKFKYKF